MAAKTYTHKEALARIEELELKIKDLKKTIKELEQRPVAGRKKHDDAWQEKYDLFVKLYEDGYSIVDIVDETDISRRTLYRYKEYYDSINVKKPLVKKAPAKKMPEKKAPAKKVQAKPVKATKKEAIKKEVKKVTKKSAVKPVKKVTTKKPVAKKKK